LRLSSRRFKRKNASSAVAASSPQRSDLECNLAVVGQAVALPAQLLLSWSARRLDRLFASCVRPSPGSRWRPERIGERIEFADGAHSADAAGPSSASAGKQQRQGACLRGCGNEPARGRVSQARSISGVVNVRSPASADKKPESACAIARR